MTHPNPGSAQAVNLGCRCPVIQNHWGAGVKQLGGGRKFWVAEECPLHAERIRREVPQRELPRGDR
jgi:hypothetical protein